MTEEQLHVETTEARGPVMSGPPSPDSNSAANSISVIPSRRNAAAAVHQVRLRHDCRMSSISSALLTARASRMAGEQSEGGLRKERR